MKRFSPKTYQQDLQKLRELKTLTAKQAQEIKALRTVIEAQEGLFYRSIDQHPEAMKKLQFAQQNLSRFNTRHRQARQPLALLKLKETAA